MTGNIIGYLTLTACFLLLFFLGYALIEPYKERLIRLFRKISGKTAMKFFYIWIGILVLRKLLYYIPFTGFIQTPASVWWVDKKVLVSLYAVFIAFLLSVGVIELVVRARNSAEWSKWGDFIWSGAILCFTISGFVYVFFGSSFTELPVIQIIFSPLLVLKMFCSGKYSGLIVSLALAYFIAVGYKKIGPGLNRRYGKFLLVTGLILIGFGVFIFYKYPGNWGKRFLDKVKTANSERAYEDLPDAVKTITDHKQRIEILKKIAVDAGGAGNIKLNKHVFRELIRATIQYGGPDDVKLKYLEDIFEALAGFKQDDIKAGREIFQGTLHLARTMKTPAHKSAALKEIILTIVKIGEVETDKEFCQQAIDMMPIMHFRARLGLFEEIAAAVAKTANKEWAKVIFLQLIDAVETITNNGWFRYDLIRGVLQAVSSREDMKGETAIFTAALNTANNISYWRNKSLALQAIASALAKTGDIQWAVSVALGIPDTEIKSNTLTEIRERRLKTATDKSDKLDKLPEFGFQLFLRELFLRLT
jgi:hypothetical protein